MAARRAKKPGCERIPAMAISGVSSKRAAHARKRVVQLPVPVVRQYGNDPYFCNS